MGDESMNKFNKTNGLLPLRKILAKFYSGIILLIVVLPILFPIYFVIISSLKNMASVYKMPPVLIGFRPILDHYQYIFKMMDFGRYTINSASIAIVSTFFTLILGMPAAYVISRYKMRKTSNAILMARLLPSISFLLPYYLTFSRIGLIDTYSVLILSHMVVSLPLVVWIMATFISDIPYELEEAARIDGSTSQGTFINIILPISGPGLVSCATLSFISSWNNFQFALILGGEKTKTLPVSLQNFIAGGEIRWGRMLAASIVVIVPAILITMVLQKYVVSGLTSGAIKG
jgi:multiple sugar transport system permease protein